MCTNDDFGNLDGASDRDRFDERNIRTNFRFITNGPNPRLLLNVFHAPKFPNFLFFSQNNKFLNTLIDKTQSICNLKNKLDGALRLLIHLF